MCDKYMDVISRLVDNELNDEEKDEIFRHMEECEECRNYYEFLINLENDYEELYDIEMPENFHNTMQMGLEKVLKEEKIEKKAEEKATKTKGKVVSFYSMKSFAYAASLIVMCLVVTPFITYINSNIQNTAEVQSENSVEEMPDDFVMSSGVQEAAPAQSEGVQTFGAPSMDEGLSTRGMTPNRAMEASAAIPEDLEYKETYIDLEVDDLDEYEMAISGYTTTNQSVSEDSINNNIITTSEDYDNTVDEIIALGDVESIYIDTIDMTDEIIKLNSEIASNNEQLESYKVLLDESETAEDVLLIQDAMYELESKNIYLQNELNYYYSKIENPSISVNAFVDNVDSEKGFTDGLKDSLNIFSYILSGLFYLIIRFSIPIAIVLIIVFVVQKIRRR